jgi:hypothetical protein
MSHDDLLVVSTRGESIGKVIHHDGDECFLVERGIEFPRDFVFHYESITGTSEDGTLVYTVTECSEEGGEQEEAATSEAPPADDSPPRT